jgi:hypothetical protein
MFECGAHHITFRKEGKVMGFLLWYLNNGTHIDQFNQTIVKWQRGKKTGLNQA